LLGAYYEHRVRVTVAAFAAQLPGVCSCITIHLTSFLPVAFDRWSTDKDEYNTFYLNVNFWHLAFSASFGIMSVQTDNILTRADAMALTKKIFTQLALFDDKFDRLMLNSGMSTAFRFRPMRNSSISTSNLRRCAKT